MRVDRTQSTKYKELNTKPKVLRPKTNDQRPVFISKHSPSDANGIALRDKRVEWLFGSPSHLPY